MSCGWVFNEKSAIALAALKDAVKNGPKKDLCIWKKILEERIQPPENAENPRVPIEEIEVRNEVTVDPMTDAMSSQKVTHNAEVEQIKERWLSNCQFTDDVIDEIRLLSKTGHFPLFSISKVISTDDISKFVAAVCMRVPNDDPFFEHFCAMFLVECLVEKEHCRLLESALMCAFIHEPLLVAEKVIVPLMELNKPQSIIHNFLLSLQDENCKLALSVLVNSSSLLKNMHQWHIPILLGLYKQATSKEVDQVLQAQIVHFLKTNANSFTKEKNFGKLLFAVVQNECSTNKHNLMTLESISVSHDTAFKKPCLAALGKYRQNS